MSMLFTRTAASKSAYDHIEAHPIWRDPPVSHRLEMIRSSGRLAKPDAASNDRIVDHSVRGYPSRIHLGEHTLRLVNPPKRHMDARWSPAAQ